MFEFSPFFSRAAKSTRRICGSVSLVNAQSKRRSVMCVFASEWQQIYISWLLCHFPPTTCPKWALKDKQYTSNEWAHFAAHVFVKLWRFWSSGVDRSERHHNSNVVTILNLELFEFRGTVSFVFVYLLSGNIAILGKQFYCSMSWPWISQKKGTM